MLDPYKIRKDFPMYQNHITMQGHPLVWLDNASTTFKPYQVIEKIDYYYNYGTANSHRGDYDLCYGVDVQIMNTRKAVAKLINCEWNEVVFTAGTTASINLIASGYAKHHLKEGDEIIVSEAEHASNLLPWFDVCKATGAKLVFIELTPEGRLAPENLEKAISDKTRIVSLAQIGNVLGYLAPIKEMVKIAHQHGAVFCLDGAQTVPHIKVDVKELDCDFLSFSGHKMLGPTGIGVLYGKYDILKQTEPYEMGGGMNNKFFCTGEATYLDPPYKFEAGTQNIAGIFGLEAAVNYLLDLGMENIEEYERWLKKYAIEKLSKLDNITIYNSQSESGIVTFNIKDVFAQDAVTFLNHKGIACRSGQHCAKVLIDFLKTPATVRASFYFYNTTEDIDALVDAVKDGGNFLDAFFN